MSDRISVEAAVCGGRTCIRGTRITVRNMLADEERVIPVERPA